MIIPRKQWYEYDVAHIFENYEYFKAMNNNQSFYKLINCL